MKSQKLQHFDFKVKTDKILSQKSKQLRFLNKIRWNSLPGMTLKYQHE